MYGYSSYGPDLFSSLGFAGGFGFLLLSSLLLRRLFVPFCCIGNMFTHSIKLNRRARNTTSVLFLGSRNFGPKRS